MENKTTKILIIQLRQLGDVLMTTPIVRQLHGLYPNAQIHFLTEKLGSNVYQFNSNVNKIIIIPRKLNILKLIKALFKIQQEKYDLVIDCFSNPKSAQFCFFSRAKIRIGFAFKGRKYAYTKSIKSENNNEYSAISKLRLIESLGGTLKDNFIEFPISSELNIYANEFIKKHIPISYLKKIVAFNVASRREYKIWDKNEFISLANYLIKKGYYLLFTYGPGEKDLALPIFEGLIDKQSALIDYPIPSILELRALLEHCCFYIGNDGGIKHLSVCAQIPSLTIFQNINWTNWTPPNSNKHFGLTKCENKENFCYNCFDKTICYKALSAEDVIQVLDDKILKIISHECIN